MVRHLPITERHLQKLVGIDREDFSTGIRYDGIGGECKHANDYNDKSDENNERNQLGFFEHCVTKSHTNVLHEAMEPLPHGHGV